MLTYYFKVSNYSLFYNVEDDNGDFIGEYDIPSNGDLAFTGQNALSNRGDYDVKFHNILPMLMAEDYDGNWSMAVRIKDKADPNRTLFEHLYSNFQHYDFNEDMVINECDATTTYLNSNGQTELLNYDRLSLTYDGLADLTELKKIGTYFNTVESDTYNMENNIVETFLYDKDDEPVINGKVIVRIIDNGGNVTRFNEITNLYGKIEFLLHLNNGSYIIELIFEETEEYKICEYTFSALFEFEVPEYHFDYPSSTITVITPDTLYQVKLLNSNNVPVSGMMIYYSLKDLGETNYSYESKLVTDNNGNVNIPINYTNDSKYLKVSFKGFIDSGIIHPSCYFKQW